MSHLIGSMVGRMMAGMVSAVDRPVGKKDWKFDNHTHW
jgi:hypothetical protein